MAASLKPDSASKMPVLCAMMFLQFFAWGAWYVSMTGWINEAGLSGLTALAYSVCPIAAIVSPLFLGMVADRFFPSQKVLGVLNLLGAVFMVLVPLLAGGSAGKYPENFFHPFILLLLGYALCFMPTLGLTSTIAFRHISDSEKQFPVIRVFGTVGWIVGNIMVTLLPGGDKSPGQFYLTAGVSLLLGLLALSLLPQTPPPLAGQKTSLRQALGLDALWLLKKRSYLIFIVSSFLICIPLSGYYQQARNFVDFSGFGAPTFIMSFGQVSEIVFMLVMPLCFARLGIKKMILVGMLAWVARYGLFAGAVPTQWLWMVVGGVLLHGVCYDFFFVSGQIYTDKVAPTQIRGQAQGFLVLVTQGLGLLVGNYAFGKLVAAYQGAEAGSAPDWVMIWLWPALLAGAIALLFLLLFKEPHQKQPAGG